MNKKKITRLVVILTGLLIGCLTIQVQKNVETGTMSKNNEAKPKVSVVKSNKTDTIRTKTENHEQEEDSIKK
jgi:hypothetical protein